MRCIPLVFAYTKSRNSKITYQKSYECYFSDRCISWLHKIMENLQVQPVAMTTGTQQTQPIVMTPGVPIQVLPGQLTPQPQVIFDESCYFQNEPYFMPRIEWSGHIVFVLSVCLSVCLMSTLTFAITFEPLEIETSYLACPFKWHIDKWP